MLEERRAVRMSLLRWTVHLVTARDCMALRPVVQDVIERRLLGQFRRQLAGLDPAEVAEAGRALLRDGPLPASRLGDGLRERWPDRERLPLSLVVTARVPTVQPPPRGLWRASGAALQTPADRWLGRDFDFAGGSAPDAAVLRSPPTRSCGASRSSRPQAERTTGPYGPCPAAARPPGTARTEGRAWTSRRFRRR